MPVAARSIPDSTSDSEAFHALLLLAERRTGRIPPDRLVRHVLSVTAQAGWPVQRAALEAVLRRLSVAKQDRLVLATAPSSGRGSFTTRRKGSAVRPHETLLEQVEPLRATCDSRDFVRNSLGLCKHGGWMARVRLVEPSDGAGPAARESVPRQHFRRERDAGRAGEPQGDGQTRDLA